MKEGAVRKSLVCVCVGSGIGENCWMSLCICRGTAVPNPHGDISENEMNTIIH